MAHNRRPHTTLHQPQTNKPLPQVLEEGNPKPTNTGPTPPTRLSDSGTPISGDIDLPPGTLIDRFGHDDTTYFAPFGTPFCMRCLPPRSLNDEYAVYQVRVSAGTIAPGFEQMGVWDAV